MRTFLFRGKREDNDEWLQETAIICDDELTERASILDVKEGEFEEVQTMTVSQYTGLEDCNGKQIFENDVVRIRSLTGVISWHPYLTCFYINVDGKEPTINSTYATLGEMWKEYRKEISVIGDIFQPEYANGRWKEL